MYEIISGILEDKQGKLVLEVFGKWHLFYLLLIFGGIILTIFLARNKEDKVKKRIIDITINSAFILYVLDFFLMPFSYGYIDVDKLPFHICTLMGLMAFISRNNKYLSRFITQFTLLALIGSIMYISYPSGVADGSTFPFSYRVIQTMLYHGLLVAHGVLALVFSDIKLEWKKIYKELVVICLLAFIAVFANTIYSGELGEFNWFFVSADPFGLFPENIAPYVMPFVMIVVIFVMDLLIYSIYFGVKSFIQYKNKKTILNLRRN